MRNFKKITSGAACSFFLGLLFAICVLISASLARSPFRKKKYHGRCVFILGLPRVFRRRKRRRRLRRRWHRKQKLALWQGEKLAPWLPRKNSPILKWISVGVSGKGKIGPAKWLPRKKLAGGAGETKLAPEFGGHTRFRQFF